MKKISYGILIINKDKKILLCEIMPTPSNGWTKDKFDLPKGGKEESIEDFFETDLETVLRELKEETSIVLTKEDVDKIVPLETYYYNKQKDLCLFLFYDEHNKYINEEKIKNGSYQCNSFFIDEKDGKEYPEIKGFKLFDLNEVFNQIHFFKALLKEEKDENINLIKKQIFLNKSMAYLLGNNIYLKEKILKHI